MKWKTKENIKELSIWIVIAAILIFTISLIDFSGIYDTVKKYSMMSLADIKLWELFIIVMIYRLVFGST